MSDIEKLAKLAEHADDLLSMASEIKALREELSELRANEARALTTKQAAEILDVTPATVVNWVNKGMIPAIMSRNGYRIPANRLFQVAEKQATDRASFYRPGTLSV